jgi:hypothetical protein
VRRRSELFSLRSCRRVCRRAGSRRAEARRNRSPRCLRGTLPRAQCLNVALAADPLFAAEAELHLALEHPHDLLICVTVRLDMDAGSDAPPYDHPLITGENAAGDLIRSPRRRGRGVSAGTSIHFGGLGAVLCVGMGRWSIPKLLSSSNAACIQIFAISNNIWRCLSDLVSAPQRKQSRANSRYSLGYAAMARAFSESPIKAVSRGSPERRSSQR